MVEKYLLWGACVDSKRAKCSEKSDGSSKQQDSYSNSAFDITRKTKLTVVLDRSCVT